MLSNNRFEPSDIYHLLLTIRNAALSQRVFGLRASYDTDNKERLFRHIAYADWFCTVQ
jgi:hypothetical protein